MAFAMCGHKPHPRTTTLAVKLLCENLTGLLADWPPPVWSSICLSVNTYTVYKRFFFSVAMLFIEFKSEATLIEFTTIMLQQMHMQQL